MKLVIEIPDEDYNNIEPFLNGETIKGGFNLFKALEIIKNGTPLDDVLDKIREEVGEEICLTDNLYTKETNYTIEHSRLLEILDYIGKSESEEEMPNSLKSKIKHLCHNRTITESECDRILKALEQEPCEDCISRQAVIDCFKKWQPYMATRLHEFENELFELQSVNPQKIGHWIADVDKWGDVVTTVNGYRCDKCNTFNADKDNYCPYCGAKMVEQ